MKYVIEQADWDRLMELSAAAHRTPVIALSVADGIAGRDFASLAHERVMAHWRELAKKYGFRYETVRPCSESERSVFAEPVAAGKVSDGG